MEIYFLSFLKVDIVQYLRNMLVSDNESSFQPSQHHDSRWPGDSRSQGIGSHGVDIAIPEYYGFSSTLQWRHNDQGAVSNHRHLDCLLNRLFKHRYKKNHQSIASLAFVTGIHRQPVVSPHKGPVARKMFPFDDVIMERVIHGRNNNN